MNQGSNNSGLTATQARDALALARQISDLLSQHQRAGTKAALVRSRQRPILHRLNCGAARAADKAAMKAAGAELTQLQAEASRIETELAALFPKAREAAALIVGDSEGGAALLAELDDHKKPMLERCLFGASLIQTGAIPMEQ